MLSGAASSLLAQCIRPTALVTRLVQLVTPSSQLLAPRPQLGQSSWLPVHPNCCQHSIQQRGQTLVAAGNAASTGHSAVPASARTRRASRRSQVAAVDSQQQQQQQQQQQHQASAAPADAVHAKQKATAAAVAPAPVRRGRKTTAAQQAAAAAAADPLPGPANKPRAAAAAATAASTGRTKSKTRSATETKGGNNSGSGRSSPRVSMVQGPHTALTQPLPHVLILHTGGTLGMDAAQSFEVDPLEVPHHPPVLKKGTGGIYAGLEPGQMLSNIFQQVPELCTFANLDLQVVFNKDSSRVGPKEWVQIAKLLDKNRHAYDAFLVVHGTDTLAYTASALSLMLGGFKKPIVMTGSQLPLSSPRSDARQNLIDALTCATASFKPPHVAPLHEVAVCFGGRLMRGNRTRKVDSSKYQAFDSPSYPYLASLGVDVDWNERFLLRVEGGYVPRFKLEPAVMRVPVVPGCDPRTAYGDLVDRGVKGIVLEAFGVGNFPDLPQQGWVPWLRQQTRKGLQVYLASQCHLGPLNPELYKSGALALEMGVEAGPQMTPECAVVKMMMCLAYPDIPLGQPLAGEL